MSKPEDFLVEGLEKVQPAYAEFDGKMYAGLMPVLEPETPGDDLAEDKKTVGQMMFWMFEPPTQTVEKTIAIWLNGGPGKYKRTVCHCRKMTALSTQVAREPPLLVHVSHTVPFSLYTGCSSFNCGVMMENSPVTQPLRPAGFCCLEPTPELSYNEKYAWTQVTTMLYVEQPLGTGFSYGLDGYEPDTEVDVKRDLYNWLQYSFYQVFPKFREYNLFITGYVLCCSFHSCRMSLCLWGLSN